MDPKLSDYPEFMREAHRKMESAVEDFRRARNRREREAAKARMREAQDGCEAKFREWEGR